MIICHVDLRAGVPTKFHCWDLRYLSAFGDQWFVPTLPRETLGLRPLKWTKYDVVPLVGYRELLQIFLWSNPPASNSGNLDICSSEVLSSRMSCNLAHGWLKKPELPNVWSIIRMIFCDILWWSILTWTSLIDHADMWKIPAIRWYLDGCNGMIRMYGIYGLPFTINKNPRHVNASIYHTTGSVMGYIYFMVLRCNHPWFSVGVPWFFSICFPMSSHSKTTWEDGKRPEATTGCNGGTADPEGGGVDHGTLACGKSR